MQETTNPRLLKERQQKYERLIRMVKGFQRTHEQLKLLEKIKSDTVFEISLRFRRCEANKTYKFPKKPEADDSDTEEEDMQELVSNKELVYSLHSQNRLRADPSREKHKLKLLEIDETAIKRQKTEATTSSTTRVLSYEKARYSRQRIDRIQKLHHWAAERERLKTQRASEKKNNRSAIKIPTVMYDFDKYRKVPIQSEPLSKHSSNHFSQIRTLPLTSKREVCKTEISPSKGSRSRQKIKLPTQSAESPPRYQTSQKKLYTEESGMETVKKGRIHNFLSNEVKKVEKTIMLANMAETHKVKPKNLFYKQVF